MDTAIPDAEPLVISLRAYAQPPRSLDGGGRDNHAGHARKMIAASGWVLIFDTETTTDAAQALRFGSYQVRFRGELREAGLLHDAASLTARDLRVLARFADANGLQLITREEFVDRIFYGIGYDLRATIVGFNLPFDIARIAIGHGSARGAMRGGFTFRLSADKRRPAVQIKHLSQRTSLIRFAAPFSARMSRSERGRGDRKPIRRGYFVDLKTFGAALFSRSFGLGSLSEFLKIEAGKLETEEHGKALTRQYVAYAVRDAEATWQCYQVLLARYQAFGLKTPPHLIYSEASIGKAYLDAMNVRPWRQTQPDAPAEIIAIALSAYFGGRAEVRIRREVRQVVLCDFLSMYPTVNALMGLWAFVIGQGMRWREATEETRCLLDTVTLADLQRPETWPQLCALVQLAPEADILPVRADYGGDGQATIGLNYLTSDRPLWFTLADAIASKLLTGRAPRIVRALVFGPDKPQRGLTPVPIAGNPAYRVDPTHEDFFKRLIELRQATKRRRDGATPAARDRLDAEQNALKIAANSTGYGIFAETNVKELAQRGAVVVHSAAAEPYTVESLNDEEPGRYFHPLLAALITGAARLMLAITERLLTDEGLEWAFCDTDSMAIAKPVRMKRPEFLGRVGCVVDWFGELNPYDFGGSILKVEDVNSGAAAGQRKPRPLYCWAVSAKRYALFNLDARRRPVLRKASAHGLGHIRQPYDGANPAPSIPPPAVPLAELGVDLWQHDAWWAITRAALKGRPDAVGFNYHSALEQPAVSRYGATTPRLLKWMETHNHDRPHKDQVKPFGFLLCLFAAPSFDQPSAAGPRRHRPRTLKPIAPFDKDAAKAARRAFDRETGEPIAPDRLKSFRQVLAPYPLHPEGKFLNGDFMDRGVTRRRHVRAVGVRLIGKEANRWEEQFFTGIDEEAQSDYGTPPDDMEAKIAGLRAAAEVHGLAAIARRAGVPIGRARTAIKPVTPPSPALVEALSQAAGAVHAETVERERSNYELIKSVRQLVEVEGLGAFARRVGVDPRNLAKVVTGQRRFGLKLAAKLKATSRSAVPPYTTN